MALVVSSFLGVQAQTWKRPSKPFHDIVSQPAPHGTYLRRTLKDNFPRWWNDVSRTLYENGHNLPEMNEYDHSIEVPNHPEKFDTTIA